MPMIEVTRRDAWFEHDDLVDVVLCPARRLFATQRSRHVMPRVHTSSLRAPLSELLPARRGRAQRSFAFRLRTALVIVMIPCGFVGLATWAVLARAEDQSDQLDETVTEQAVIGHLQSQLRNATVEVNLLAHEDAAEDRDHLQAIAAELDDAFTTAVSFDDRDEREAAARAEQSWHDARVVMSAWIAAPIGQLDSSGPERFHELVDTASAELSALDASSRGTVDGFKDDLRRDRVLLVAVLGLAAVVTAWVGRRLRLAIYRPLGELESSLNRVSAGGPRERMEITGDREFHTVVHALNDMSDRLQHAVEELEHQAFHDSLTGLANRALFHDRVEHALQRTLRTGTDVAVVYLDIDGFKGVNDSLGHEAGDRVLRQVASRLVAAVRTGDTVARLGGDEFAILVEQSSHPLDEASTIADRVLQSLTDPVALKSQRIVLSASIGIVIGDAESTSMSMLRDADIAMYRGKSTGKARWTLYDPAMRAAAVERLDLESDLYLALDDNQFRLVYQPIVELETERVVGFEALLRWHHPTRGVIVPDVFIPIAEDNGSIVAIGAWVLAEACRTGARWHHRHPDLHLSMAVNLSGQQMASADIVDQVRHALRQSGLPPASLVLELTETVLVKDAVTASQRLRELRDLHVKLAIDDFGTGYSSLSYLRQFSVDILKIDRSFVNTISDRDEIPPIVRGLIDLGKTLKLEIVAEGIELGVQRDSLRDEHCDFGQGFLFARPLSEIDAGELLDSLAGTQRSPSWA